MPRRSDSELSKLRKLAFARAEQRNERLTTVHLLAAVAGVPGPAQTLLASRKLDEDKVLRAARTFDEEVSEAVGRVLDGARDVARRAAVPSRGAVQSTRSGVTRATAAPPPGGLHVLVVILSHRRFAAYRALAQLGVDITRLRTLAMQMAAGVVALPRAVPDKAPLSTLTESGVRPQAGQRRGASLPKPARPPSRPRPKRPITAVGVPIIPPLATPHKPPSVPPPSRPATEALPAKPPVPPSSPARKPRSEPSAPSIEVARASAASSSLELDPEEFPVLAVLGRNLTAAAERGELDTVVARDDEIEQALDILAKRHANSVLLLGQPGVGKTSVARGVAQRFAAESDRRPRRLLIELPLTELLAGTSARGSLAERAAALRGEVRRGEGRIVLFIDEIHELISGGGGDELVAELKAALSQGELPLIGATTPQAYQRTIESDGVLARRFSIVDVEEPDEADTFLMLRTVADGLEQHHRVTYTDQGLAVAVSWSIRYLPGRALPDKAVSILDLAGARARRRAATSQPSFAGFADAAPAGDQQVDREQIAEVVSELADVPTERLLQTDHQRLLQMESLLAERVVGHPDAMTRISAVLRRNGAGLRGRRPIGTFLLLGPTGVGKTETAKAVAEALFHSPDAMTRLDMSEYAEPHSVARLIGAPPGYVGHEAGGELTESVRRRPYQVVLLDEIEKAHRDVLEAFLQLFDEGRLTDGRGRCVDYTNTVIVMTSNLGSAELRSMVTERRVGFGAAERHGLDEKRGRDVAIRAAKSALPPELYNRIDEVIFYRALDRSDVRAIAERLLDGLAGSLGARGVELEVEQDVIDALLDAGGFDPEYGARPMRRAIARLIEAPLADLILQGELERGSVALVSVEEGGIVVDAIEAVRERTA